MCTEHVFSLLMMFGVLFVIKGLILKENYQSLSDKMANFGKKDQSYGP